jgi:plastocyanin
VSAPGTQLVTGKAPAAAGLYPAIVVFEPVGGDPPPAQTTRPVMDQEQQTFVPSLLLVRTGQPVDFLNHDDVLHNVRVRDEQTKESAFNVAIPTGETFTYAFQRDGFFDVGCDIHPGMSAQIMASSSPYAVVADPSGAFSIADVPDGPYRAIAYAGADRIEKEINVTAGSTTVDLTAP